VRRCAACTRCSTAIIVAALHAGVACLTAGMLLLRCVGNCSAKSPACSHKHDSTLKPSNVLRVQVRHDPGRQWQQLVLPGGGGQP
jgi:hypothetical protein